jgi:iron complex transport system substrate-binding protein
LDLRAQTFGQVIEDALAIAAATGNQAASRRALESLDERVRRIRDQNRTVRPSVMLIEWVDPLFCSGHWTPELIDWAGGRDPVGRRGEPSREISAQELIDADPEILLVACCGLDAARSKAETELLEGMDGWSGIRAVRTGQVHCFDGSAYFNRPGPRLVDALETVDQLIRNVG